MLQNYHGYYIDFLVLIRPDGKEVASTLDALLKHICKRGWEMNPINIQGLVKLMKFRGMAWGTCEMSHPGKEQIIAPHIFQL